MPRNRDQHPAVRVYTVCDESKYLIVRNVPALGCTDDLVKLFSTYGDVEDKGSIFYPATNRDSLKGIRTCKPMDEEECEKFTDVYWIKFCLVNNARFAKRKLDESVFLGNQIQVTYATQFESLADTKEKLEGRKREVLARLNPGRSVGTKYTNYGISSESLLAASPVQTRVSEQITSTQKWIADDIEYRSHLKNAPITTVSSDQDYFVSPSMNQTVQSVREKLNKIQSGSEHLQGGVAAKKPRMDNRRRI